jgi:nicotinamidase-related amidase
MSKDYERKEILLAQPEATMVKLVNLWYTCFRNTSYGDLPIEQTDTALIILDVQVHMFSPESPVYQGELLLEKIGHLQEKAHQAHIPIIYIQQGRPRKGHPLEVGSPGWQLHPLLVSGQQDILLQKQMPSAFYQTTLDAYFSKTRST